MQERRLFPRYPIERSVELLGAQGARFQARTSDISATGLGLRLSRAAVLALAQGGTILTTGDDIQLAVARGSSDPWPGELSLNCRVKHVRRLSQDEYLVGVWLIDPSPAQKSGLEALVAEARSSGAG